MGLSIWYWLILLLFLLLGGWGSWSGGVPEQRGWRGGGFLLLFALLVILGMAQFGGPVRGG